jgi:hypothetical protein
MMSHRRLMVGAMDLLNDVTTFAESKDETFTEQ